MQFGFQKGLSTYDALLMITVAMKLRWLNLICAAFDRVNHETLIFKLQLLGVDGLFFSVLSQFLSGRTQKVVVDG